jgi:hypothetical protein
MEELIYKVAEETNAELFDKISNIGALQKSVLATLDSIDKFLDIRTGTVGPKIVRINDRALEIENYRSKLVQLKAEILKIDEKCTRLQDRLNHLRQTAPPQHALVEEGPFWYKCTFKGGVRFREYPSGGSKCVPNMMISCNEHVLVSERVFITGESSVFLHVPGVGWLFENKDSIHCLERSSTPTPSDSINQIGKGVKYSDVIYQSS